MLWCFRTGSKSPAPTVLFACLQTQGADGGLQPFHGGFQGRPGQPMLRRAKPAPSSPKVCPLIEPQPGFVQQKVFQLLGSHAQGSEIQPQQEQPWGLAIWMRGRFSARKRRTYSLFSAI